MSYTALYRKWRPSFFKDVKGQEPIIRTLKNQIKTGKIGHAYLFCGSRGTGKTTIAKIFAKAINCEHTVDGEPCGECEMCKAATEGYSINVFEIDAASNNGVEFIRQIEDEIQYPPAQGRYSVYIIDEVHMLSPQAFNAFLKTLEEPPAYVVFILATTEPHKIPATILSRCQQYDFRRIGMGEIIERLKELCVGENISIEDKALEYIARKADGGLRDAISLLDRAEVSSEGTITYDSVLATLGAVDNDIFSRYVRLTIAKDVNGLLALIDEIVMSGREISQFCKDLGWYLRNVILVKASHGDETIVDASSQDFARLKEEADSLGLDEIVRLIRLYSTCYNEMRQAVSKRVFFEITAIKSTSPEADFEKDSILARLSALEARLGDGYAIAMPQASIPVTNHAENIPASAPVSEPVTAPAENIPASAPVSVPVTAPAENIQASAPVSVPQSAEPVFKANETAQSQPTPAQPAGDIVRQWGYLLDQVGGMYAGILASTEVSEDEPGTLTIYFEDSFGKNQADMLGVSDKIKSACKEYLNRDVSVRLAVGRPQTTAEPQQTSSVTWDSTAEPQQTSSDMPEFDEASSQPQAQFSEEPSYEMEQTFTPGIEEAIMDAFAGMDIEEE